MRLGRKRFQVLIVGAGAAGLIAGRALRRAGVEPLILEAKSHTGGRIQTAPGSRGIELGAEFIHGEAKRTKELLREYDLPFYELNPQFKLFDGKGLKDVPDFWNRLDRVFARIRPTERDRSFDDFLRSSASLSPREKILAQAFVEGFHAAETDRISANAIRESRSQVADPEERMMARPLGGYVHLIQRLTDELSSCIRTEHRVESLSWKKGHVAVIGNAGRSRKTFRHEAPQAIITLPVGVLKGGQVRFDPIIPDLDSTLAGLQMGHVSRLTLEFKSMIYQELFPHGLPFISAPAFRYMTWWSHHPLSSPVITAWSGGTHAIELEKKNEADRTSIAIEELSRLSRHPVRVLKEALIRLHSHSWTDDLWTRGAYTYPEAGGSPVQDFSRSLKGTLHFAGEAFESDHTGTVEGAFLSGENAAHRALKQIAQTSPAASRAKGRMSISEQPHLA